MAFCASARASACSAPTSISRSRPTTSATRSSTSTARSRRIKAAGGGLVGLVGVQSNQFPRALDLAGSSAPPACRSSSAASTSAAASRCCRNCRRICRKRRRLGIVLFAGEGEGRMARAAARHRRRHGRSRSTITCTTCPAWKRRRFRSCRARSSRRVAGHYTSFDAGRGCPFQCSFCTIINVQGRKSRYRTPDDVEAIVRANAAQGVTRFFVTDDNFARNKNWEPILDRLIELRERQGFNIRLLLQVDTLCHRIPGFIEKAARAGCNMVFIGLENINPEIADGHQEAPEQDLGISRDAAGLAQGQGDDLGRLHPRLPDRHAGDRSRATSKSSSRSCRSTSWNSSADAAAGLGGSQEAPPARGPDGPRHEQVRSRARLHGACGHVEGGVEGRLSRRLAASITPTRTWRRCCGARPRQRPQPAQDRRRDDDLFRLDPDRGCAPAAVRVRPPQGAHAAPLRHADREPADLLSAPRGRVVGSWCGAGCG